MSQATKHENKRELDRANVLEKTQARVRLFDAILNQALDPILVKSGHGTAVSLQFIGVGTRHCRVLGY
jgi:hypothetical protein